MKASRTGTNSHRLRGWLLPLSLSPFAAPHLPPLCPLTPIPVTAGTAGTVAPDEVCHPASNVPSGVGACGVMYPPDHRREQNKKNGFLFCFGKLWCVRCVCPLKEHRHSNFVRFFFCCRPGKRAAAVGKEDVAPSSRPPSENIVRASRARHPDSAVGTPIGPPQEPPEAQQPS